MTVAVVSAGCRSCFRWVPELLAVSAGAMGNSCCTQYEWVEMGGGKSPFLKLSKKYVPCSFYEGVVKGTRNILYKSLENSSFPPPIPTHFLKR